MKKHVRILLEKWVKQMNQLGEFVTPKDFDSWVSGFVCGYSYLKQSTDEETKKEMNELIDYLLTTKVVKNLGITGTEKEVWEVTEME